MGVPAISCRSPILSTCVVSRAGRKSFREVSFTPAFHTQTSWTPLPAAFRNVPNATPRNGVPERSERLSPYSDRSGQLSQPPAYQSMLKYSRHWTPLGFASQWLPSALRFLFKGLSTDMDGADAVGILACSARVQPEH